MFSARAQVLQHGRPNRGTDDAESDDAVHGLSPLSPLSRCCPRPSPLCPLSQAPPQNHLISRSSSSFPAVAAPLSETTPNHMLGLVRPRIRAILVGDVGYSLSSRPVMAQSLVAPRSSATIFVDLHAAWRRALRGPSWFDVDLRRSFDHSFDQVGGCWCNGLKNGVAATAERAAAAAGRTPAADDASGQSDSTARVGASGIR